MTDVNFKKMLSDDEEFIQNVEYNLDEYVRDWPRGVLKEFIYEIVSRLNIYHKLVKVYDDAAKKYTDSIPELLSQARSSHLQKVLAYEFLPKETQDKINEFVEYVKKNKLVPPVEKSGEQDES